MLPALRARIHRAVFNDCYAVLMSTVKTERGDYLHLWIRNKSSTDISWREKQRIKNELVGKERVAIEVYPPEEELVDTANMYHLWVLPPGERLHFWPKGDLR